MLAAQTLNRSHIHADGKTGYQRWNGKRFRCEVAEFGETIMHLKVGTKGVDKFNARWERGTWLGIKNKIGEVTVGTPEGVIKAREFRRHGSIHERGSGSGALVVCGIPWEPMARHQKRNRRSRHEHA